MNNREWSNIGEEIRGAVEKALTEGDFTKISDVAFGTISDTMKNVSDIVGNAVNGTSGNYAGQSQQRRVNYTQRMEQQTRERQRTAVNYHQNSVRTGYQQSEQSRSSRQAPFFAKGRVASVLYKVFGGILTGIMSILTITFMGLGLAFGGPYMVAFVGLLIGLVGSLGMIYRGCWLKKRLNRALSYLHIAGNNHYANIEDIADHTGKNKKAVLKDIKYLLNQGFYPQGHLDHQESCLMLDNNLYNEYLNIEKQRKLQERENKSRTIQNVAETAEQNLKNMSELEQMIAQGQGLIKKVREINDRIAGEEISAKLFRLENILREIFDALKEHPEQLPQMKKFMNYYLPTTLKLVQAYEEFDSLSSQGEDIQEAKVEIEKTLDTINASFAELLNRMYRDTVYDVTTDAQVLQTMLANEGLAGEDVTTQ